MLNIYEYEILRILKKVNNFENIYGVCNFLEKKLFIKIFFRIDRKF